MATKPSFKHLQIDKANTTMLIVVAIAAFVTVFSLLSAKSILNQLSYQDRVISAKDKALTQLKSDVTANQQLITSYQAFESGSANLIGGTTTGNASNDGGNAKIVLDALPSIYDFPALTSSLQIMLGSQGVNIDSIGGTDEQASLNPGPTPSGAAAAATIAPAVPTTTASGTSATAMPFEFSVDGPYQNIDNLLQEFEKSIRPFQFQTIQIAGKQSDLTMSVTAQTFYQPEKNFKITTETVQ